MGGRIDGFSQPRLGRDKNQYLSHCWLFGNPKSELRRLLQWSTLFVLPVKQWAGVPHDMPYTMVLEELRASLWYADAPVPLRICLRKSLGPPSDALGAWLTHQYSSANTSEARKQQGFSAVRSSLYHHGPDFRTSPLPTDYRDRTGYVQWSLLLIIRSSWTNRAHNVAACASVRVCSCGSGQRISWVLVIKLPVAFGRSVWRFAHFTCRLSLAVRHRRFASFLFSCRPPSTRCTLPWYGRGVKRSTECPCIRQTSRQVDLWGTRSWW